VKGKDDDCLFICKAKKKKKTQPKQKKKLILFQDQEYMGSEQKPCKATCPLGLGLRKHFRK